MDEKKPTPAAIWREEGKIDPHQGVYDCKREELCMGKLTDDEMANGIFMNYDVRPNIQDILDGKAFSPIAWITAGKDRIRWLSRQLVKAEQKNNDLLDFIRVLSLNEFLPTDLKTAMDHYIQLQEKENAG